MRTQTAYVISLIALVGSAQPGYAQDGDAPGPLTRALAWAESKVDGRPVNGEGVYPELGGMIPGAGFSVGPGFRHRLGVNGPMVDVSAAMSWQRYSMARSEVSWPRLFDGRVALGAQAKFQDFTQISYFGIGRDSQKGDQTDYRFRDVDAGGFAAWRATRWLSVTGRAGVLRRVDVDRGSSSLHPSIETRFDDVSAPGLLMQPNYVHGDVAIEADTRDQPGRPRSGGVYRLSLAQYHDQDLNRYSFARVEADAVQYLPLGTAVVSMRGRMAVSQTGTGQDVPFYLQPALGGANSLRGYLDYRFRDRDLVLVGAEVRQPVAAHFDAAAFYDAGTVSPTAATLFQQLRSDYGVGLRLRSGAHTFARLDVAKGTEGTRVLLRFSPSFGLADRSVAPYVP